MTLQHSHTLQETKLVFKTHFQETNIASLQIVAEWLRVALDFLCGKDSKFRL